MYTGIILVPWIILFGATGVLFNHPNLFSSKDVIKSVKSQIVKDKLELKLINSELLSSNIIDYLNYNNKNKLHNVKNSFLDGKLIYSLNNNNGRHYLYVNMHDLSARIESRPNSQKTIEPKFLGKIKIDSNNFDWNRSKQKAKEIFKLAGIESTNKVNLLSRSGPKIFFNAKSVNENLEYNLVYNLIDSELSGRQSGFSNSPLGIRSTLLRLHMLHTYPDNYNFRWFWSLFVDATGVMLILWGLSGLVMWWQIKPTRILGIISISVALISTIIITFGTVNLIVFDGPFRSSTPINVKTVKETNKVMKVTKNNKK